MRASSFGFAVALSVLCVASSAAQEHPNVAKGLGGFSTAGIDTVNPFNGNLVIRLPIGQSYPVNARLSYGLVLTYNSQVWEHETYAGETRVIPARAANAGLGWSLQMGRLNPPRLEFDSSSPDYNRNTYLSPDGSTHTFYPTLHEGESPTPGFEHMQYTRDGTYLRLNTLTSKIEFPDGSVHSFSGLTNGYLTRIEDRFSNFVRVEYLDCGPDCVAVAPPSAHRWRITDTQGRAHLVHLRDTGQQDQPLVITQVALQAFGGSPAIYKFLYNDSTDDQSTTGSPVGLTGCQGYDNHLIWFLTRLVLPDGSVYDMPKAGYFSYNVPGDLSNPCKTGLINRLRLPTLGLIEWDYRLYRFPSASTIRNIWQKSTGVWVRRLLDRASQSIGQWTYDTVLSGGTTAHETRLASSVTDPLGNKVTRTFSVCVNNCSHPDGPYEYGLPVARDAGGDGTGRFLSMQVFNAGATPLRTSYARYEHDTPGTSTSVQERSRLNQRLASQRTVFNDDPDGTYADEDFSDFDGHGHYRRRTASGFFPQGSNARSSHVHYNPSVGTYGQPGYARWLESSPWVLNTYLFDWDEENGKVQFRVSCFEAGTGFLLRHRVLKNSGAAESPNDLLQVFQRDTAGNVTSESHYGGDTQNLPFDACGLTPPTSPVYQYTHTYTGGVRSQTTVQVGTALRTLDLKIDSSTGLPNASADPAGKQTTFNYDLLGRLTTVDPADDLLTTYTYCTATSVPVCPAGVQAQVVSARKTTIAGAEVTATRQRFDDWGRLIREEERMPPSGAYSARTFSYNALGWKTYVSELGSANGTSFLAYDAFGRPLTIRPPDGAAHEVTLSYQGVRQVQRKVKVATSTAGESTATTTEIYDRHGRLYEVTEPNGIITRYDYDVGNRLSKVCQNATGTGTASCGQQRLFTYDHRGFLLSERHPEKGAGVSGNGTVSYFNYDARGHAGRKVDGPNNLTFTYDKAERLIQVRETGGAQRVLKTFTYAPQNTTTGLTDWRKGKLASASRFNYVILTGIPYTVEIKEDYAYTGREGRTSSRQTQLLINGTVANTFAQGFTYTELGQIASLDYPNPCSGCPGSGWGLLPRTVSFGYTNGFLTSIPGFATISYHNNGLVNQVAHTNGITFTQANDPKGLSRPASMTAVKTTVSPNQSLWTTGTYNYDGAGNVKAIGTQSFVYDSLSRVAQGNLPGSTQSYSYDIYGNIQSITTDSSTVNTFTSSATNRLTSGTYDGAGNLIFWAGNSYEYDPFNLIWHFTSGGEDWLYIYTADDERLYAYQINGNQINRWTLRDLDGNVLRQYTYFRPTGAWHVDADYVYRDGRLLANAATGTHFDVDHLGSVRLITNAQGNQVGFHRYYPFGKEHTALQEGERMKFTGHERDLASLAGDGDDLDYMHARHYSPLLGRFLSTDPGGPNIREPQSWNRYAYVNNSPLKYTDPTGMLPFSLSYHYQMQLWRIYANAFHMEITVWAFAPSADTGLQGLDDLTAGRSTMDEYMTREDFAREVLTRAANLSEPPVRWIGIGLLGFFSVAPGFAEAGAPATLLGGTMHGAERMSTLGRLSVFESVTTMGNAERILTQADGATVFIQQVEPGKFNVVIQGSRGVITNLRHISQRSLDRLAVRYGWW